MGPEGRSRESQFRGPVLQVISTLGLGGAEYSLLELCGGLMERGVECQVCFLDGPDTLAAEFEARGVPVHCLHLPHKAWPALWRLRRVVEAVRPRLIHAHLPRAGFWAALLARPDRPVVYTEHNVQERYPAYVPVIYPRMLLRIAGLIAVSEQVAESFRRRWGQYGIEPVVVRTSIDTARLVQRLEPGAIRRKHAVPADALLLVAVGGVRPEKGYVNLVRAVQMLRQRGIDARALIVGSTRTVPEEARRVEGEIDRLGLRGIVELTGEVPDGMPYEYLRAADIVVMSSLHEGLPRVLLEAMAAGKPIVATRVGGCPEAIVDGESGRLVEPGRPEALAEAIAELAANRAQAQRMGEAARRRLEAEFSLSASVQRHLELYGRLLGGG